MDLPNCIGKKVSETPTFIFYLLHCFGHFPYASFHQTWHKHMNQCTHESYKSRILEFLIKGCFTSKIAKTGQFVYPPTAQGIGFWESHSFCQRICQEDAFS